MCSDAGSFDLTGANLGAAIQEVLAAVEVALVRRDNEGQTDAQVSSAPQSCFQSSEPSHRAVEGVVKGPLKFVFSTRGCSVCLTSQSTQ